MAANTPRTTLASDDPLVASIGATTDAAATVGGTGSLQAKNRLMTTLLDAIKTAAESTADVPVKGSGTAGTAASGVVTVQGIASMTKLLVTPDSVALPANQSVNAAQINMIDARSKVSDQVALTCHSAAVDLIEDEYIRPGTAGKGVDTGPAGDDVITFVADNDIVEQVASAINVACSGN